MIKKIRHSRAGFTLIELLIGMTIFSVGITSIFLLLQQTIKSASIAKNEIIVANLLREQLELVRNQRDTNYKNYAKWNEGIEEGFFLVENNFDTQNIDYSQKNFFVKFDNSKNSDFKITNEANISADEKENRIKNNFEKSQLCKNSNSQNNFWVHCDTQNTEKIPFASYTKISPIEVDGQKIKNKETPPETQGYVVDARVIVKDGNFYREYDAKTILTDWQK